ncbi:MAG: hypothetical protein KF764_33690 [Labilithrix sp.]|nr:hypothetical protein [Labilithrix sp.]
MREARGSTATLVVALVPIAAVVLAACSSGGPTSDTSAPGNASSGDTDGGADPGTASSSSGDGSSGSGAPSGDCAVQQIAPAESGGCAARIVTPRVCELVDLSGGGTYELAWTTDGTGCETPWKVCLGGSPLSDPNSRCVELSTDVNAGITRTGGVVNMTASDFDGLTSADGVYHLLVASFYGSHLGSLGFRVKR